MLVDTEVLLQSAPFLGITPEKFTAKAADDPTTSSPLYVTASTLSAYLEAHPHYAKVPHALKGECLSKCGPYFRFNKESFLFKKRNSLFFFRLI